jgi:hypothetical protein
MTNPTPTAETIAQEIRAGMEGVTPGPWADDSIEVSTDRGRCNSYGVHATTIVQHGACPVICDAINAGIGEILEESDGESFSRWDELARKNMAYVALCSPDRLTILLNAFEARGKEIERLAALVYVPGLWRCAKCNFSLLQGNLNYPSGTVTVRDDPGDRCPNCDSPLWRVSERQAGNELVKRCEELADERDALRAKEKPNG